MRTFTVSGSGAFPVDMLRYDQCWPKTTFDATGILLEPGDQGYRTRRRAITLQSDARQAPTVGRWTSFGWAVTQDSES